FLSWQSRTNRTSPFSHPELLDLRNQSTAFSGIAAYQTDRLNISGDQVVPEQAEGAWLTANAFDVLLQQPLIGRSFAPGEDAKGTQPVVILSYKLWQRRYGGNPGVVGTAV